MPDEPKKMEEAGHTSIVNDVTMLIDDTVLNNPNWVEVSVAAEMIKKGDRQTRNIADKAGWEKRYGRVKGLPRLHYPRNIVEEHVKKNGPHDTFVSSDSKLEKGLKEIFDPSKENKENHQQLSSQLSTILETHKKVLDQNIKLQDRNTNIEKQVTLWKTSLFWLVGVSIIAGGLWWSSHKELSGKLSELSQKISSMALDLSSKDNELSQTKTSLTEKETELKTIKDLYKIQNREVSAGGTNDNSSK